MFISTMTYEEIYQAISMEMPDIFAHFHKIEKPKVDRALKKATQFPKRISIDWTHPKSRNTYTYYIQSNRPSQWNNPFMRVCCEYEGKYGKELLIVVPNLYKKELQLQVFRSHFYKQYGERFLNGEKDYHRIVALYLLRNTNAASLGKECVSLNEQQEEEPCYTKESMLTIDGLGLGLRSNDGNIVVYRTFVCFDQLFDKQFEKIWSIYLYFVAKLAIDDSPKHAVVINGIYEEGATKMRQLADDKNIAGMEKWNHIYEVYEQTYQKLVRYIAI